MSGGPPGPAPPRPSWWSATFGRRRSRGRRAGRTGISWTSTSCRSGREKIGAIDADILDSLSAELDRCREHCSPGKRTVDHRTPRSHECDERALSSTRVSPAGCLAHSADPLGARRRVPTRAAVAVDQYEPDRAGRTSGAAAAEPAAADSRGGRADPSPARRRLGVKVS